MNFSRKISPDDISYYRIDFRKAFREAIPTMEEETTEFFKTHLTAIDGDEFWEKCKSEFPYGTYIINQKMPG